MGNGIIDIHSHILPGVDDGAVNWEECRQMLEMAYAQGIRTIIATPHYCVHQDMDEIRMKAEQAAQEAARIAADFQVYLGQEVLYFESMTEHLKEGKIFTMAGSQYVLAEFMTDATYKVIYQAVRKLLMAGYHPIIAHVERYIALRKEDYLQELVKLGCHLQMNYRSLEGNVWDARVRWCRKQVQSGLIYAMGTDAHRASYRTPVIAKSLRWLNRHVEAEYAADMTEKHAQKILFSNL